MEGTAASQALLQAVQNDPAAMQQLQTEMQTLQVETMLKATVSDFQKICFTKCIEQVSSNRMSRGEETCLIMCAQNRLKVAQKVQEIVQGMIQQQESRSGYY